MISDILQLDGKEAILLKAIRFPLILLIVVLSSVLILGHAVDTTQRRY